MRWLADGDFKGDRTFAAHTGMQQFDRDVRWRASDAEEGILLAADGRMKAIMPGQTVRPGALGMGEADLFVFRRSGKIEGRVGAGDIFDAKGARWGGFGKFTGSLLMPRLLLPGIRSALQGGMSVDSMLAELMRPALRGAMERALRGKYASKAQLRTAAGELAFEPMRECMILHGLLLESFDIERFERTEGYHA